MNFNVLPRMGKQGMGSQLLCSCAASQMVSAGLGVFVEKREETKSLYSSTKLMFLFCVCMVSLSFPNT